MADVPVIDKEPDSPAAISIPFKTLPTSLLIWGNPRSLLEVQLFRYRSLHRPWRLHQYPDHYAVVIRLTPPRSGYPVSNGAMAEKRWEWLLQEECSFTPCLRELGAFLYEQPLSAKQRDAVREVRAAVRNLRERLHIGPQVVRWWNLYQQRKPFEWMPQYIYGDPQPVKEATDGPSGEGVGGVLSQVQPGG